MKHICKAHLHLFHTAVCVYGWKLISLADINSPLKKNPEFLAIILDIENLSVYSESSMS